MTLKKLFILFGGGNRGLGLSLKNVYKANDFNELIFEKRGNRSTNLNYFDADNEDATKCALSQLTAILKDTKNTDIHIHIILGGSLGIEQPAKDRSDAERVLKHNYMIPTRICDECIKHRNQSEANNCKVSIVFYSSSVTINYGSTAYYRASKCALEAYYQSTVSSYAKNINLYLLRLGVVSVEHKYFGILKKREPENFEQLIKKLVPSEYDLTPDKVAKIAYKITKLGEAMNGTIIDISGGHSWSAIKT